jgi:hypothetical protein
VKVPRPAALRLVTTARTSRPPRPLFGLAGWTTDAPSAAVLLDATGLNGDDSPAVAHQLPPTTTLPAGTLVVVSGAALRGVGVLGRLFRGATTPVSRAARCGALVARGYVDVGAGVDPATKIDIAWGRAPGDPA